MKKNLLKISIVILFLALFALLDWNSFTAPFERDEGEYAYSAWLLRTGDMPYRDSFLQKPPMIIYTYAFGQVMNPWAVWPPRVIASLFIFLTAILVYLIAKKEWGSMAGIFSVFLFLPMISFPVLTPFTANTEKFMILPMVALLAIFVYFKDSQKSWPYLLAGFLAATAIFYKPICLFVVAFIIIFWLFKFHFLKDHKISSIIKPLLLTGGSFLFTIFLILLPFIKVWPKFYEEIFIFNSAYISSFGSPLAYFGKYLSDFLNYWWILLFLIIGFFFKKPKNILYYFILIFLSLILIFTSPIGHYYLILMPFLALVCGALFSSCLVLLNGRIRIIVGVISLFFILYIIIFPFGKQFSMSPQKLSEWVYGTVNPFGESKEVATHLAEITNPNDYVFIAGSEPQIYYYAKRKSMTRFIITYPLNLPTSYREKFQNELMSNFKNNPPQAIVVSNRAMSGLWNEGSPTIFIDYFTKLISENYNIIGGYIWDNNENGYWKDLPDKDQIERASLLLLTKNK